MKTISYMLRFAIAIILFWIGYILLDTFYFGNSVIGNGLSLVSAFACFLPPLLLILIHQGKGTINKASLLLGSISLLFTLTMFFVPFIVIPLWNFALSIFTLFIMHSIFLLTGSHEGKTVHKSLLGLTTGFLITILLFKIECSVVHIVALSLCFAVTITSTLSIFGKKI